MRMFSLPLRLPASTSDIPLEHRAGGSPRDAVVLHAPRPAARPDRRIPDPIRRAGRRGAALLAALPVLIAFAGCKGSTGDAGPAGPAGAPGSGTFLERSQDLPGLVFTVLRVTGSTGGGGQFEPGDVMSVHFTVTRRDGSSLPLSSLTQGETHFSGPTFNYQRVLPRKTDLISKSVQNTDGSYTYAFDPIPATYANPANYTGAYPTDVLAGTSLVSGTYTIALIGYRDYTVATEVVKDVGNTAYDVLVGTATAITPREVVTQQSCEQCHVKINWHNRGLPGGGRRTSVKLCMTCHTAGAEDFNHAGTEKEGEPKQPVEFKVLIHRIHNGSHLPSVLGVGTDANGNRVYDAPPRPMFSVSDELEAHDWSGVNFPMMPSAYASYLYDTTGAVYQGVAGNGPMPRNTGFAALAASQKLQDDRSRTGVVACGKCHGTPSPSTLGLGPDAALRVVNYPAPAQGNLALTRPSRRACGSCHDDVDFTKPYIRNGSTMPPQPDDSNCVLCHVNSGNTLDTIIAHTHPYTDPTFNTGVDVTVTGVAGGTGTGGNHQAGDPVQVTFAVKNDAGADLNLNGLTRIQMMVTGPTANPQWLLSNVNAFDNAFRKSSPFTGNGTINTPTIDAGAIRQTIGVVHTAATSFDVVGSVGAPVVGVPIGATAGSVATVSYGGVTFTVTQGSTAFANGDRWYFEVIPTAASYTVNVPYDVTSERLGLASGGADVFTIANAPLYWGRQKVYERTAISVGTTTSAAVDALYARHVVVDAENLAATGIGGGSIGVGDKVVLDAGTSSEEYLTIGRIQTTDDASGTELGAADRVWFTTPMRFTHAVGTSLREVTLTSKREGLAYTVVGNSISLVAGQFGTNPVVIDYRTDGRFGWHRAPGDALQALYPAAAADSDDIDITWGDWRALSLVDGTYTVGIWANRDFTLTPLRTLAPTEPWNNFVSDNTTYRMISPPATRLFLFGAAEEVVARAVVSSGENCNACHGDLQFHGYGRRGLETCLVCHAVSGAEDGPRYSFDSWNASFIPPTPGATMDFRTMIHKVHAGEQLTNASSYQLVGVFLGVPYPFAAGDRAFPAMNGGVRHCAKCHGLNDGGLPEQVYDVPADRSHPSQQSLPLRRWRSACGSCHDSSDTTAHMELNTYLGQESCATCHGRAGATYFTGVMHKPH